MRRLASALSVLLSAAALSACNGLGGSALGNSGSSPNQILFTDGSGYQSFFKVAPGATTPLVITAVGTKTFDIIQSGTTFTWTVAYGTTANTYELVNATTGITTYPSCPAVAATANAASGALVVQTVASGTSAGGNVAYAGMISNSIGVLPSGLAAPAATAPVGSGTAAAPVYCLVLTATANNGLAAPVTVLVSN